MAADDGTIREFGADDGIDFSTPPPLDSGASGLVSTVDDYQRVLFFSQRMMTSPQPPESYVAFWSGVYESVGVRDG